MPPSPASASSPVENADEALASLRDTLRSARRWHELLSESERRSLLADIARVALAIGNDLHPEPPLSDLDVGEADSSADVCPRERLAFLRAVYPRVSYALRLLENAPPTALVPATREVSEARVSRRITPQNLLAAVRSGDWVRADPAAGPLAAALGGHLPRCFVETITVPTRDTPPLRAIKAILVCFVRDLGAIARLAAVSDAPQVEANARALQIRLREHLRREPWCDLPVLPHVGPISPSVRASGPHRLLHETYRKYRAGFALDWATPLFTVPARETWLLYEYWTLFQTAAALRALGFRAEKADEFALSRSGLTFTLVRGRASRLRFRHLVTGQSVLLTYNPRFVRADDAKPGVPPHEWQSRSYSQHPDITLESDHRLLVLDAKFKTYSVPGWESEDISQANNMLGNTKKRQQEWRFTAGMMHPDMQQMHSYRDAIAYGEKRNVVWGAWLLYAGRTNVNNPPTLSFPREAENQFGNHELGAICLRPGADAGALQRLISAFLGCGQD